MATGPLVIVSALGAVPHGDAEVVLTRKFVSGMESYARRWPGRVVTLMHPLPAQSHNLDNVRVKRADLPFGVEVVEFGTPRFADLLRGAALVVGGPDHRMDLAQLCRGAGVACTYVTEYSLRTRLDIARAETPSLLRRLRRVFWERGQERRTVQQVRAVRSLQCNGTPTWQAYRGLCADTLLYFDTRTTRAMMPDEAELRARQQRARRGEPLSLVFSGRLDRMKGADHLVPVAARLRGAGVPFRMTIYGDGALRESVAKQVAEHGLGDAVQLAGVLDFQSELVPRMRATADLFVCCHRQGDPSCTYMETLACGVPIAGYANEAWAGMLAQQPVGWSVPMDGIDELAAVIVGIHRDRGALAERSEKAWRWALEHDFDTTFERRVQHYLASARA